MKKKGRKKTRTNSLQRDVRRRSVCVLERWCKVDDDPIKVHDENKTKWWLISAEQGFFSSVSDSPQLFSFSPSPFLSSLFVSIFLSLSFSLTSSFFLSLCFLFFLILFISISFCLHLSIYLYLIFLLCSFSFIHFFLFFVLWLIFFPSSLGLIPLVFFGICSRENVLSLFLKKKQQQSSIMWKNNEIINGNNIVMLKYNWPWFRSKLQESGGKIFVIWCI